MGFNDHDPEGRRRIRMRGYAAALAVLTFVLLASASGCWFLGVAAYKFAPPKKIPPAFVLPTSRPTVVMVDRPTNFGAVSQNAQQIARLVTEILSGFKTEPPFPPMIESGAGFEARLQSTIDGQKLKPSQIAASIGAKQFIYVELDKYEAETTMGGEGAEATVDARVWVVDTETASIMWPVGMGAGYPVSAKIPFTPIAGKVTQESLRTQLDEKLAGNIARLFTGYLEEP